jgi:8-oxo-dGTP diphosphatase
MKDHFRPFAAVYLLFIQDGKVLMLRRANTGYEDGMYSLVAGHVDGNETLRAAAVREGKEESGVDMREEDLTLAVIMHRLSDREYLDFFFVPKQWKGEPVNMEPAKCDDLNWFPVDAIPENTIPYVREAIRCYREGIMYSEFGWEK